MSSDKLLDEVEVPGRPSPSVRDLLDQDTRPVKPLLVEDRNDYVAKVSEGADVDRYFSREFQARENELMWSRVWQVACREEQIPKVGDYVLYEIAGKSLIVTRSGPDEIRAFYNACQHRGRTLCEADGHAANFRCRFHGWVYSLQGKLAPMPSAWDFPHVDREAFGLAQVKVGRWGGFVFINMDPDSIPFETFLKDIPEHFADWAYDDRHLVAHVGQVVRANWKVASEAFLENYHVVATHSQVLKSVGDANSQYSVRKDRPHYSRLVFATGLPSPHVVEHTTEEEVREAMIGAEARRGYDIPWPLPEGKTLRACAADSKREQMRGLIPQEKLEKLSDSELIDGWVYTIFPNFTLWGGFTNLCYRFRPWGDDPEMALMEIMILPPWPRDKPRPPAPKMTLLGPDQSLTEAPELGPGGAFFAQDISNMPWMQKGMRSFHRSKLTLGRYQESQIRHFHDTLDRYLAGERPA